MGRWGRWARAAAALALFALGVGLSQAQTSACLANSIGVAQGSVFSVFSGGQVSATQTGSGYSCAASFYGSGNINAGAGQFAEPTGSGGCVNASNGSAMMATGQTANPLTTIPAFQSSASTYAYTFSASNSTVSSGSNSAGQILLLPYTVTWSSRTLTVPPIGGVATLPSATYTDWGTVSATGGATVLVQSNAANVHINTLSASACGGSGGFQLAPGNYFVSTLSLGAGCQMSVSGSGVVNLYVQNAITLGTGSCLNWNGTCGSAASSSTIAAQNPANLRIWSSASATVNGAVQAAAALYVVSGSATFAQSGVAAWVGEVVAPNIQFANASGAFAYANTNAFTGGATVRTGVYALAAPAVPASASTGSYVYFAEQQDVNASGQTAEGGHLYAQAFNSDGSINPIPAWDAAALMTVSGRTAALVTDLATGGLGNLNNVANNLVLLLASLVGTLLGNGYNAIEALINPNWQGGLWLSGRDPTNLMGRPMATAPIIAGKNQNIVVVGTDDGILYGFNAQSGSLVWGYYPSVNLLSTLTAGLLIGTQPWGQLAYYNYQGSDYVLATGDQGSLHLALQLNGDGTLGGLAWQDWQPLAASPGSPTGGAAPTMAIDQTGSAAGKVAYIVGNNLVRRSISNGANAQTTALPTTATSNLIYINDSAAYYGDINGSVKGALGASDAGSLGQTPAQPVIFLTGDYQSGVSGYALQLLGSSSSMAAMLQSVNGTWSQQWQYSSASSTGVPNLPANGAISAMPSIAQNMLFLGVTIGSTLCSQTSQEIGPLSVINGAPMINGITFRTQPLTSTTSTLGVGASFFAAPGMLNGKAFVFADGNGGGSTTPATDWGQYALATSVNRRIDWRELTSFVVSLLDWAGFGGPVGAPGEPDRLSPAARLRAWTL
jgi:hypothetical protein